jgi:hypothetical protein
LGVEKKTQPYHGPGRLSTVVQEMSRGRLIGR